MATLLVRRTAHAGEATGSLSSVGHVLFALGLAGLGGLSLVTGRFAYLCQPVPAWVPDRPVPAYASGALLLGCAVGLFVPRIRDRASVLLAAYALASMLVVHVPRVAGDPLKEVLWFGLGEMAVIVAGAWLLFARTAPVPAHGWRRAVAGETGTRRAGRLFGVALLPFGLSHFVYAAATASLVPSWLPAHFAWAYLTGAGHLAAGLAILLGVLPRLGATLEALMVSAFVLSVHVPDVLRTPGGRDAWSELFVACFVGGVAWLVARSYRTVP